VKLRPRPRPESARPRPRSRPKNCYKTETINYETETETETSLVNSAAYESKINQYAFIVDYIFEIINNKYSMIMTISYW